MAAASPRDEDPVTRSDDATIRYRVRGMDCASCAAKVEGAARRSGIPDPAVSTTTQVLSVEAPPDTAALRAMEAEVSRLGYGLDRIDGDAAPPPAADPAYRRALWIVVALNLGYGVVEMAGGFLAGSQALKADALDFLGDGAITLLGVVAIGWSLLWRARSALIQGVFLGVLGLGVIAGTLWRLLDARAIEAGLMGGLALAALAVNVAAAVVLLPHRRGDANMRAVWLFSRNDALGNVAVVAAAALVWATGAAWPDLVVALAIAGLFLHSSRVIVSDALRELRPAS